MIRFFLFVVLLVSVASAAPLASDLGQGLSYRRVHLLPADLPTADSAPGKASILDLRYATGDADAAAALAGWLKFHATASTPVFVLANIETGSALLTVLTRRDRVAGLIVLGAAGSGFVPDLAITVTADAERRAYDAAEHGTSIDSLINPPVEKARNDEAKLAHDRQAEPAVEETEGAAPAVHAVEAGPAKTPGPAPLTDPVLQRAVHLHRTLLALKKI